MSVKEQYSDNRKRKRIRFRILFALACIVVFATTYALILPAITMEKEVCDIEEHTHTESCYEVTEAVQEQKLICGKEESEDHQHTAECYETVTIPEEKSLVCGKTEHTHTIDCLSGSDREAVEKVINLIDELPSAEEIDNELAGLEDNDEGYDAYLEQVMGNVQYAHEQYEALGSDLQKYVSNADRLQELSYMWEGQVFATTDSLNIYQVNSYDKDKGEYESIIAYSGSEGLALKNALKTYDSMGFNYWKAIVVSNDNGFFKVTKIINSGDTQVKKDEIIPTDGFIILTVEQLNVAVGNYVYTSSGFYYKNCVYSGTAYGTVSFKDSLEAKKTKTNKELETVEGAHTSDLIEVNLYDYGDNINEKYNDDKIYPGFQQDNGSRNVGTSFTKSGSFNFGNNITSDLKAGISNVTNKGGDINKTTNGANSPISGAMSTNLGDDGYPALSGGKSLGYLFSNSTYATKQNKNSIDGLFRYNGTTGAYTFNSRENHAQFNEGSDTFTLYKQMISSNFMMYPFGNFLPFNDIVSTCKNSSEINRDYLIQISDSAMNKFMNGKGEDYKTLAIQLRKFIILMDKAYPNGWTAKDCANEYFKASGIPKSFTNEELENIYTIDYDEPTDFYFGMEMKMNFMQPKGGLTGPDGKQQMVFYFTGDDDVWVYLDGKLALDLSGIHRHVGGEIDFVKGEVRYYTLDVSTGDVGKTPYKTVKFSDIFDSTMLNDKGTFKDYSTHSFNFYYMERGAGSGVCRMNFNFPLLQHNSISVTKELSSDTPGSIVGNPDFSFQILKKGGTDPFITKETNYLIKDANGNDIGTGTVGNDGVFTLKAGQTAVFSDIPENAGEYYVRELMTEDAFGQYGHVFVDGVTTTKEKTESFTGVKSPDKDMSDGSTVFHFNNEVTFDKLGSLSIRKTLNAYTGNHTGETFDFKVKLDGVPLKDGSAYYVGEEEKKVQTGGIITISAGETAKINNILSGTSYEVEEVGSDELYNVKYSVDGGEFSSKNPAGVISTDTETVVSVVNSQKDAIGVEIPFTKSIEFPDDQNHTYSFTIEQINSFDDTTTVESENNKTVKLTLNGDQPVTGKFVLGYRTADISGDKKYYYKVTEEPTDEQGTVFDTSVYIAEVSVTLESAQVTYIYKDGQPVEGVSFVNKLNSFELPQTGGLGTLLFTLGGILLILAAGSLLIYRRRRGNA